MGIFASYAPEQGFPLGSYLGLVGAYHLGLYGLLSRGAGRLPPRVGLDDLLVLGLATHKLTRVVASDWVTSPFRAPFARYEGSRPGGEVSESSRGRGLRRAIGDLVTCNYCTGPWVAGALVAGLLFKPRETRTIVTIFAGVAVSDWLHHGYDLLSSRRQATDAAAAEMKERRKRLHAERRGPGRRREPAPGPIGRAVSG